MLMGAGATRWESRTHVAFPTDVMSAAEKTKLVQSYSQLELVIAHYTQKVIDMHHGSVVFQFAVPLERGQHENELLHPRGLRHDN